jgi:hypothetical protein
MTLRKGTKVKTLVNHALLVGCLASSALALDQRDANPPDELPSYIRKLSDWGQRAIHQLPASNGGQPP